MEFNEIIRQIVRGSVLSLIIFILSKLFILLEWTFNMPRILEYLYAILEILIIFFILKSRTLKDYGISAIVFVFISVLFIIVFNDMDNKIFKFVYGIDSEMGTGTGFMLLSVYLINIVIGMVGLIFALCFTIKKTRAKN